jgi:hypothetical protein
MRLSPSYRVAGRQLRSIFIILVLTLSTSLLVHPLTHAACGTVTSIQVNGKSVSVNQVVKVSSGSVEILFYFEGNADSYRICESSDFKAAGCDWKLVANGGLRPAVRVKFTLSEGSGIKTVYFQAKRGSELAEVVQLKFEKV